MEEKVALESKPIVSRWANRFIWASIIQGLFAVAWTIPIVLPNISPSVAQVIASGSAGTWFLVGYTMYIVVGVFGAAVTALFYHHLEVEMKKTIKGFSNALAWVHLVVMNVGAAAVTWALMFAGYFGEADLMPASEGGKGLNAGQVHVILLSHFIDPVGVLLIITALGVLAGGLVFVLTYFRKE